MSDAREGVAGYAGTPDGRPTAAQIIRFIGYLKGFDYDICQDDGNPGHLSIADWYDAETMAQEYLGCETESDAKAIFEEGRASGDLARRVNWIESGATCIHRLPSDQPYGNWCDAECHDPDHYDADRSGFLCESHWLEYEASRRG